MLIYNIKNYLIFIKKLEVTQKTLPEPQDTIQKESNAIIKTNKNEENTKPLDTTNTENGTAISTLIFLQTQSNMDPVPENLNVEKIPKDTISTSTGTESNNSQQDSNSNNSNSKEGAKPRISFAGKTKRWAGNVWNSIKKINIKKMFPKTEYQEYRNANGDMVKIPKKKLPLKKKKHLNDNVLNQISKEQNKIVVSTYDGVASGLYFNQ